MPAGIRHSTSPRPDARHVRAPGVALAIVGLVSCSAVPFLQKDPREPQDRSSRFERFVAELDLALTDTAPILDRVRQAERAEDVANIAWSEERRRSVRRTVQESARRRLEREYAAGRLQGDQAVVSRILAYDLEILAEAEERAPDVTSASDLARTPWEGLLIEAPSVLAREHPRTSAEDLGAWLDVLQAIVDASRRALAPATFDVGRDGTSTGRSVPRIVTDETLASAIGLQGSAGAGVPIDPIFGPLEAAAKLVRGRGARRFEDTSRRSTEVAVAQAYEDLVARLEDALTSTTPELESEAPLQGDARERWLGVIVRSAGPTSTPEDLRRLCRQQVDRIALELAALVDPDATDLASARTAFRRIRDGEIEVPGALRPPRAPVLLWNEAQRELGELVADVPPIALRVEPARFYERPYGRWSPFVRGDLASIADPRSRASIYLVVESDDMPPSMREAEAWRYGVPGRAVLDAFRRDARDVPRILRATPREAFEEGWGLYAVGAAVEAGTIVEVDEGFGRLAQELVAFASLLVDVGLHADGWSRRQAIDFLLESTPLSSDAASEVVLRALAHPGRLTLPAIGLLRIRALRRGVEGSLGERFDAADFHRALLDGGPVPMGEMDRRVRRWLAARDDDAN